MGYINVAVDGPAGAGKSTLARQASAALGFLYVDTGAIYRAVALYVLDAGLNPSDAGQVAPVLPEIHVSLLYAGDGTQHTLLNGRDVSERIRTPEVSAAASAVSALPEVRALLLDTQRELARTHNVIMDGRDIGTVVLPDADVKIFLTASPQERAWRRTLELEERGTPQPYEEVLREMEQRDADDANRAAAPLRQAEDAIALDTTSLTLPESLEALLRIIREKTGI